MLRLQGGACATCSLQAAASSEAGGASGVPSNGVLEGKASVASAVVDKIEKLPEIAASKSLGQLNGRQARASLDLATRRSTSEAALLIYGGVGAHNHGQVGPMLEGNTAQSSGPGVRLTGPFRLVRR